MFADELRTSLLSEYVFGKYQRNSNGFESKNLIIDILNFRKNNSIKGKPLFLLKDEIGWYEYGIKNKQYYDQDSLYDLPEHWAIASLESIAYVRTGNSINEGVKKKKYTNNDFGYPYIGTKDVNFDRTINYSNNVRISDYENFEQALKDSILFCIEGGSAGRKIALTNQIVCFGNKLAAISPYIFNVKYLYYFLQTPEFSDLFKTSISGIIGGVGINKIRSLHIPVPPLEEQEVIVNQLDYLDSLIEKLRIQNIMDIELDAKFKNQLQESILLVSIKGDLFSEAEQENLAKIEFDKYCHVNNIIKSVSHIYKDEENRLIEKIGSRHKDISEELPFEIPGDWIFIRLGDVIKLISGRDLTKDRYNSKQIGIPYMTGASNFDNGKLIINRWTTSPGVVSQKGDLLITVKGTIGDIAYNYLGDIHIARQIMALRSDFIDYEYLKMVLSYYVTDLKSKARSLIPGISRHNILNILFPLPPKHKQVIIVQKYKHMMSLIKTRVEQ